MALDTVGTVHVDQLLTNLARKYMPHGFIADIVCPRIPVLKESDVYAVWDQGPFFSTDTDDLVADKAEPREVEFGHSTERYQAARRELAYTISDRERNNSDSQLRLEETRQSGTLGRLFLKREKRVAALLRKTTNGGLLNLGADAAGKWDTANVTTIESDIFTGRETIRQKIGIRPNVIVIPEAVASGMQKNTQLVDKLKYTYGSEGTTPLLSEYYPTLPAILFGMRVIIPGVIANSANEGAAASYADVWDEQVRLLYVTDVPDLEIPSVAYTMQAEPLVTRRDRLERRRTDWFSVGFTIDEHVTAPDAGYEINNCLA